jgi:hypothetical protein
MTPRTDWKEVIPEGEEARLVAEAEAIRAVQRPGLRALHAKANAGVEGELEVLPDLSPPARAGLFSAPAKYRAYVRFSNGSTTRQPDAKGDVRGVAVKVVGVAGRKVIPGMEDAMTQDFLLIRTPTIPFRDPHEFVFFVTAAANPLLLLPRAIARLGFGRTFEVLPRLARSLSAPVAPLAATRWFSAAPIRYSEHAVQYELSPHDTAAPRDRPPASTGYLGEELADRLKKGPVVYDFRVRFYVDAARTPIEDASVEWKEEDSPAVTVARLTLPQQDAGSPRGRKLAEYIETLSFDPWHALEEHRPLGAVMRARNHAYRLSTAARKAAKEPDGSERIA